MNNRQKALVTSMVQEALKLLTGHNKIDLAQYFPFVELQELIAAEMGKNSEFPLTYRSLAVRKSLAELSRSAQSPNVFFDLYAKEIAQFRKNVIRKFYFVGTISSNRRFSEPFTQVLRDKRTRISITASFPKKIRGYSDPIYNSDDVDSSLPVDFSRIVVACYARFPEIAGLNALTHIDNLLGWLNLWQNRKTRPLGQSFLRLPINHFLLGPQQTLHSANGHRIETIHFAEPDREKCIHSPFRPVIDNEQISFVKQFLRNTQKSPVRERIEGAVRAYLRATESRSSGEFLINLRACLELLFSQQDSRAKEDVVLRRIKNIHYTHQDRVERVLLFAFHNRNVVAHQSQPPEEYTTLFHSYRFIVQQMIIFTAQESLAFSSESDWMYFLDLPRNCTELERRRHLITKALRKLSHPTMPGQG